MVKPGAKMTTHYDFTSYHWGKHISVSVKSCAWQPSYLKNIPTDNMTDKSQFA